MQRRSQEIAIAVLGHPSRARQMTVMNGPRARAISLRIKSEQDARHLGPVCSLLRGIEQANIKCKVLTVVIGQP